MWMNGRIGNMKQAKLVVTNARNVKPLTASLLQDHSLDFFKVISFEQYKQQYMVKTSDTTMQRYWKYYSLLLEHHDEFVLLKDQFQFVAFDLSLFRSFDLFKAYGLTMDDFSVSTPLQKVFLNILKLLENNTSIPSVGFNHLPHAYTTLKQTDHAYDQPLLDQLIQQGIFQWFEPSNLNGSTIDYQIGVGLNNTIETIAADMIKNQIPANAVNLIFADNTQLKSAIHVLDAYHIPHDQISDDHGEQCVDGILSLIHYYQHHDIESLNHLLNLGYAIDGVDWTIASLDPTIPSLDQTPLDETIHYIDGITIQSHNQKLNALKHAAMILDRDVAEGTSRLDIIAIVFEKIKASPLANQAVLQRLSKLYLLLKDALNSDRGFDFFEAMLKPSSISAMVIPFDHVVLTTIDQPVVKRAYSYIVGLSQSNYPGFKPFSGIIDESFVKNSPFPSLKKRQQRQDERLQWLNTSGSTIIYRFSQLDNTGSPLDLPLPFHGIDLKPIARLVRPSLPELSFDIPDVRSILTKPNGLVKASISSLECFNRCRTQYALSYLLHLRKPNALFSANMIGSLYHEILQQCISDPASLQRILMRIRSNLASLVKDSKQLDHMMQLIETNMVETIDLSSSTRPYLPVDKTEYMIQHPIAHFDFKGIIDRLDAYGRAYGIVDYKSGNKHLSWSLFEKGEQLQLISYAYLYELNHDADLSYLDYVAITPTPVSYEPYGVTKKHPQTKDIQDALDKTRAVKRYDGTKISGKKRPWKTIKTLVGPLYDQIYTQLTTGDFSPNPSDSSKPCGLCAFKSICRYTRGETIHLPLIETIDIDEDTKGAD